MGKERKTTNTKDYIIWLIEPLIQGQCTESFILGESENHKTVCMVYKCCHFDGEIDKAVNPRLDHRGNPKALMGKMVEKAFGQLFDEKDGPHFQVGFVRQAV